MRCNVGGSSSPNSGGGYKLVWTNPNPNVSFEPQTINIDLSKYKSVIIKLKTYYAGTIYAYSYLPINNGEDLLGIGGVNRTWQGGWEPTCRLVNVYTDKIVFGSTKIGEYTNIGSIPVEVYATNIELG